MYKNKIVLEIVREYVPNASGYYCLLFGNILLEPYETLQKLEESKHFSSSDELIVKVNSSASKFLFGRQL